MKFDEQVTSGEGGEFIALKDKESVVGIFASSRPDGKPTMFYKHWVDGKSHICTGSTCPFCQNGDKITTRFYLNFITLDEAGPVSKIFEFSKTVNNQLKEFNDECELDSTVVKLKRTGTGLDTTYSVFEAKKDIPPQLQNVAGVLKEVEQTDLEALITSRRDRASKAMDTEEAAPF